MGPYGPIWAPYGAHMVPYGPCGILIIPSPVYHTIRRGSMPEGFVTMPSLSFCGIQTLRMHFAARTTEELPQALNVDLDTKPWVPYQGCASRTALSQ